LNIFDGNKFFEKSGGIHILGIKYVKVRVFRQKYSNEMSIDAVFDGDYGSAIIFGKNIYIKNENRKIRVRFGM
jgi:hypothetical protein